MALNTPLWHFKYFVRPFDWTNGPAFSQALLNLHRMLNHFIFVYLDDVLSFYLFISFFLNTQPSNMWGWSFRRLLENSRLRNVNSFLLLFFSGFYYQAVAGEDRLPRSQPVLILAGAGLASLECETHRIDKSLMLSHHMNKPKFFVSFILFMSHGQLSLLF